MTPCLRCAAVLEHGDLRCAICALPAPVVAGPEVAARAQVLRCGSCGAAVGFVAEARAPRCGFCSATLAIEQPIDPIETAQRRLPFKVDRAAAEAAMRAWLGDRGWFAPPALAREAVLESLTPLSWAAWLVNAEARVAWTADSDAGAQRSAWTPHAGEVALVFRDIVVPASRGLRPGETRALVAHYWLSTAIAADAAASGPAIDGGDASPIEAFDLQRSAARATVHAAITAQARVRVQPYIPGRRHRNVRVACLLERQTTERIALPAWVLAYRYRGTAYRAIVHGQRAEVVIGRSPLDGRKLAAVIALVAVLAGLALALALR